MMMLSPLIEIAAPVEAAGAVGALSKADQLAANRTAGLAYQNAQATETAVTDTKVAQNVMVKTESGVKTQIDIMSTKPSGALRMQEAKASATAKSTPNQVAAHPEIEKTGATVVGKGKPDYPGGTKIPPTEVEIVRPVEDGSK
jgi:hypothetical protein